MSGAERVVQCLVAYKAYLEPLIASTPAHHHETIRNVLTHPSLAEQVALVLALKSEQTEVDGEYHNAIIASRTHGLATHFTTLEVGCTPSLLYFEKYWHHLGYDNYRDYVAGILYNDGKGFDLYSTITGQPVPDEPSQEFVGRFIIGHVLRDLKRNVLLLSLQWTLPDGRLAVFPPELLGAMLIITRDDIEAQRCEELLLQIIAKADIAGSLAAIQGCITFSVDGYNDDKRELWEIPEVKAYFRKLDQIAPHFLFFIANEEPGVCVRLFLQMFIDPEFFSTSHPSSMAVHEFKTYVLTRLNHVADYCACNSQADGVRLDPVTTIHQTFRSCGYLIDRSEAQAVLDAR
jgi:hypothetical protein